MKLEIISIVALMTLLITTLTLSRLQSEANMKKLHPEWIEVSGKDISYELFKHLSESGNLTPLY